MMRLICAFFFTVGITACNQTEQKVSVFLVSYIFSDSENGWTGDFSGYPENDSITYALMFKHDTIPTGTSIPSAKSGLLLSGDNMGNDLFMFVKKKVSGLKPNTSYSILFSVKVASIAKTVALGSPGENVLVKVGASQIEPKKVLQTGNYVMNIDKGDQLVEGMDMITIGDVGVSATTTKFTVITRNNSKNGFVATTDSSGEIWLIVGTDSGYVGITTLYYTQVDALFNAMD